MPAKFKPQVKLTNIHPADELQALREEIKQLERRAEFLRDQLIASGETTIKGDQYTALIVASERKTLDRGALEEAFGAEMIAPFVKSTYFKTVKLMGN
jgi:hypothetical protein